MGEYFFIGGLCAFFTVLVLVRPNFMWSILAAVSWMLLFWYSRSNPIAGIAEGDFGDSVLISICWGAAVFVLLYTINDRRKKREIEEKEAMENGEKPRGARETADEYYDRLVRLTRRR